MHFSEKLKELRKEYKLSQKDLAEKCGVSPQCISALESEQRCPSGITLCALSDFFHVSVDYLLGRTDDFDVPIVSDHGGVELSADEQRLLSLFQGMSHQQKLRLIAYAEGMADASKKNRLA